MISSEKRLSKKVSILLVTIVLLIPIKAEAQYSYGTTGLLNMPTADMQRDKTLMFGASFLEKHTTPTRWFYNTYNYYVNVTFFPWLEVAYVCTLHKALKEDPFLSPGYWVPYTYGKFINQDRNFAARIRVWKEGWWKKWTPQIVIGGNDVLGNSWTGGSIEMATFSGNGFYSRYYVAATKHLDFVNQGKLGIHVAYVYNKRKDYPLNGPCVGVNYNFNLPQTSFLNKVVNGLNLMAEYDSRTINCGFEYSFWKDYINAIVEFNECKYVSCGLMFKVHLK